MAADRGRTKKPFSDTAIAKFMDQRIEELKYVKNQRDIAEEVGYRTPNMISMLKSGDCKVPLDKIPLIAQALNVDAGHLLRLGLEQYWDGFGEVISDVFGHLASANEERLFLTKWRNVTNNMDPAPTPRMEDIVGVMLAQVRGSVE